MRQLGLEQVLQTTLHLSAVSIAPSITLVCIMVQLLAMCSCDADALADTSWLPALPPRSATVEFAGADLMHDIST